MTPKEKAEEIIKRVIPFVTWEEVNRNEVSFVENAKRVALVVVEEILKNDSVGISSDYNHIICDTDYWEEVKQEIEKL